MKGFIDIQNEHFKVNNGRLSKEFKQGEMIEVTLSALTKCQRRKSQRWDTGSAWRSEMFKLKKEITS